MQFPAGLADLVRASLAADIYARVESSDDSGMLFAACASPEVIARLPYVTNAFHVFASCPRRSLNAAVEGFAMAINKGSIVIPSSPDRRPFRVTVQLDGSLVSISERARTHLERAIRSATDTQVQARGGGSEYWIVGRRDENRLLLGRRLTSTSCRTVSAPAGSLSPQLADLLVRMSVPSPSDRFLDPFAGSDVLTVARSRYRAERIASSDISRDRHGHAQCRPDITFLNEDARELPSIRDGDVNVIVTDPPWGEHANVGDHDAFLMEMWTGFDRVLATQGSRVVALMTRRRVGALIGAAVRAGYLNAARHDLLVNGHPASAVLFRRARELLDVGEV